MAMPERPAILAKEDEEARRRIVHEQLGQPLECSRELLWSALADASWRVRKEAVEVLLAARLEHNDISALIELLRDECNAGLRNATAELLVRLGEKALPVLLTHLHDADHDLRKLVVDALAAIGDRSAVPGLIEALDDPDINVAAAAAEAIGASGERSAVPALLQALERQSHDFFRFNALSALGRIGVPGPLPPVVARLADEEMLRLAVYDCLGRIGGDRAAADLLLEGVQSRLPTVRSTAIRSLAALLQQLEPLARQSVVESLQQVANQGAMTGLLAAFDRHDPILADAVVVLLEALKDPRGVPVLIQAMTDERLTQRAAAALQAIGTAALTPALARFPHADESERMVICSLLGSVGEESAEVASAIGRALSDDSPQVRRAAALAGGKLSGDRLLAQIPVLLNDDDSSVREAALQTLRMRSSTDKELITEIAAQMLASESPEQRQGAALLCAATGDCEQLARLIKDEDPEVREAGVRAVGRLRLKESCSSLVMALVDEVEGVRIAAAEALGGCCQPETGCGPLRLALRDPSPWVQAAALRSLLELCGEAALSDALELWQRGSEVAQLACLEAFDLIAAAEGFARISQGLGERDDEVLKGVIDVLARHAPELLIPWLNHICSHPEWDVRMAGVRACARLPYGEREVMLQMMLDREDHDLVRRAILQLLDSR